MRTPCTQRIPAYGGRGTALERPPDGRYLQALRVSPEVGNRLAGLCDGEGHFGIGRQGNWYRCLFAIGLRVDDEPFLREMRDAVDLGKVVTAPAYRSEGRRNSPSAQWRIVSKDDCVALVALLDEYPLWSKKARDYAIWRDAVLYWQNPNRRPVTTRRSGTTTRVINAIDWTPIARLQDELRDVRRYAA